MTSSVLEVFRELDSDLRRSVCNRIHLLKKIITQVGVQTCITVLTHLADHWVSIPSRLSVSLLEKRMARKRPRGRSSTRLLICRSQSLTNGLEEPEKF